MIVSERMPARCTDDEVANSGRTGITTAYTEDMLSRERILSSQFSFRVFCPRGLSTLRPSLVRPFESTCDCLRVCSSCRAQYWFVLPAYSMLWQSFFWESASSPRGHRRTASSVWRAAHCTVHRKQPPLRRHQPVSTLVETSGRCCRGIRLIYQQASMSPPGGAPARSAPVPE